MYRSTVIADWLINQCKERSQIIKPTKSFIRWAAQPISCTARQLAPMPSLSL